ncbi:MAG: U32 family peptidase [Bacteroidaceae bacterium]|nr:U32 family peptidase [Bacteroidaceae bacterium]
MSETPTKIELLSPARNYETAVDAINHGADAVYIGAPRFGARQAAGNSVEDIARLCEYAHIFGVKIYVTLNTIIFEEELPEVEQLIGELYNVGVDALIVQDMGILRMNIPPIALHASTQMDNRNAEKVDFLYRAGFEQVVLARELSLREIGDIHRAVPEARIEAFVHGALCVSYSGRCYASQHCFGRSANRGACAQFCRLSFDLVDADGSVIIKDKHLLSLKDMNRSESLEQMLDAGVVSFKIEGRLKENSYVKNVTAYYRERLDEIFARRKEFIRSSYGVTRPQFTPSPEKSFSRGFTSYFLNGRGEDITSFDTPKSLGEKMGTVTKVFRNYILVSDGRTFANGDGACFLGKDGKLQGFRVNRVEGDRLFPLTMPDIHQGAQLFRNLNVAFENEVARSSSPRRLRLDVTFAATETGFSLTASDESGVSVTVDAVCEKALARTAQRANLLTQLAKWGNTHFELIDAKVLFDEDYFIPSSLVADMRRSACDKLLARHKDEYVRDTQKPLPQGIIFNEKSLDYTGNVANSLARDFYESCGAEDVSPAYEIKAPAGVPVMFCKHCIKYSLGWCSKSGVKHSYKEPFFLVGGDGRRFKLSFDCRNCMMMVVNE